jgi:uncharacterized protein (DUF1015 family)
VFPTHRLVNATTPPQQEALAETLRGAFDIEQTTLDEIAPAAQDGPLVLGYLDSHFQRPYRLRLRDQATADDALPDMPDAYRRLDTAVLEALVLKGPLELDDEDIEELHRLGYARSAAEAVELVRSGAYDVGFFLRPTPIEQVRAVAAAGESMPPKSTYFYPKVPTGLVFNLLE